MVDRILNIIISPRSIEACKRLCYEEKELLIRKLENIVHESIPHEFEDDKEYYLQLKLKHYEKRRQEKLKQLIDVLCIS